LEGGVLPDLSVLVVIGAILILAVVLDRVLLKPLLRIMEARQSAVKSALQAAESATATAQAATAEFDAKVAAARADTYRQMDERRRAAQTYRAELLSATRQEVESELASASAHLEAQAADARARLEKDAEALGVEIADKVLGRS
jgi:F-type H+-transporting ATPase subunit b